jgi:hypothetical protein
MLVIGREAATDREAHWADSLCPARSDGSSSFDLERIHQSSLFAHRSNSRLYPDVRWMEISSVLRQQLAAGRSPEQIRQIEFVGESLDMASVLQWRRKIFDAETPDG